MIPQEIGQYPESTLVTRIRYYVTHWIQRDPVSNRMVDHLMTWRTVFQHGPGNPIVVEDDSDNEMDVEEVMTEDEGVKPPLVEIQYKDDPPMY